MAQRSRFWDGLVTGDANEAPYDGPTEFGRFIDSLAGFNPPNGTAYTNSWGIFPAPDSPGNLAGMGLIVSGAASPLSVGPGRALVRGSQYESDAIESVVIPTPAGATRIDRIVLRKDWALQTVRITRIAGVEGGGAPAIVRTDGLTWDIILAQVTITTAGVITLYHLDRRYLPRPGANRPIVAVSHNADVAVGIGATVVLPWNTGMASTFQPSTAQHDPAVNNTRIYAPYFGTYRINAHVQINQINDNGNIDLFIGLNAAGVAPFAAANVRAEGNFMSMLVAGQSVLNKIVAIPPTLIAMAQGDYIEMSIQNNTDGAIVSKSGNVYGYTQYPWPRLELELLYSSASA